MLFNITILEVPHVTLCNKVTEAIRRGVLRHEPTPPGDRSHWLRVGRFGSGAQLAGERLASLLSAKHFSGRGNTLNFMSISFILRVNNMGKYNIENVKNYQFPWRLMPRNTWSAKSEKKILEYVLAIIKVNFFEWNICAKHLPLVRCRLVKMP